MESYRIEAVSGQLNVYGVVSDANTLPTFTFVDFTSEVVMDSSSGLVLLSAYAIEGESTVWGPAAARAAVFHAAPGQPRRRGFRHPAAAV